MKKRYKMLCSVFILLPILILAAVPAGAETVTIEYKPYRFFYNPLNGTDPVIPSSGYQDGVVNINAADKQPYYFSMAYTPYTVTDNIFNVGYTYNLSYYVGMLDDVPNTLMFHNKIFCGSTLAEFKSIALYSPSSGDSNLKSLDDYVSDLTYSYVFDNSTNIGTLNIIFHCDSNVPSSEVLFLAPMFFMYQTNGDGELITYEVGFDLEGYADYDQTLYDNAVFQQQTAIKNAIEDGFKETNANLEDIEYALTGDGVYDPPDPAMQEGIEDLSGKEQEVMNEVLKPIELPDGSIVQMDQNTLEAVKLYISNSYDAPDYEQDMGDQIEKIFDIFMPYLGTVIFLSLFLGLAISFLTGRRLI